MENTRKKIEESAMSFLYSTLGDGNFNNVQVPDSEYHDYFLN